MKPTGPNPDDGHDGANGQEYIQQYPMRLEA